MTIVANVEEFWHTWLTEDWSIVGQLKAWRVWPLLSRVRVLAEIARTVVSKGRVVQLVECEDRHVGVLLSVVRPGNTRVDKLDLRRIYIVVNQYRL